MNTWLRAAVESVCDAGEDTYISQRHKKFFDSSMQKGLLGGIVGAVVVMGSAVYLDKVNPILAIIPLVLGLGSGVVVNSSTKGNREVTYREDFQEVCGDENEEEDEEV